MNGWVLDSSFAVALGLPDEDAGRADELVGSLGPDVEYWVPALWWYELANAVVVAQRRKRVSEAEGSRLLEIYGSLPVHTDFAANAGAIWKFKALAQDHGLTAYDAAYLELAERRGLGLASLDRRLIEAARKAGVKVRSR